MADKFFKWTILALAGGLIYGLIETLGRGYTHWTMVILGGICFVSVGLINETACCNFPFPAQMLMGGIIITVLEFITGCIVNIFLKMNIWDYSGEWGNLLGQICPKYFMFWIFISAAAIVLDDLLRKWIFGEKKRGYKLL